MKKKLLIAISEHHSGNKKEGQRIASAIIDMIKSDMPDMIKRGANALGELIQDKTMFTDRDLAKAVLEAALVGRGKIIKPPLNVKLGCEGSGFMGKHTIIRIAKKSKTKKVCKYFTEDNQFGREG